MARRKIPGYISFPIPKLGVHFGLHLQDVVDVLRDGYDFLRGLKKPEAPQEEEAVDDDGESLEETHRKTCGEC